MGLAEAAPAAGPRRPGHAACRVRVRVRAKATVRVGVRMGVR